MTAVLLIGGAGDVAITIDQLVDHYPFVYHVAERVALDQVRRHGLLSTTAILDLFEIFGEDRFALECSIRKTMVRLEHPVHGKVTLRDQKPLSLTKLTKCLQDGLRPEDWIKLLNRKVFTWVSKTKVEDLLGAREYRDRQHIVFEIDTRSLVTDHLERITLAAMNTGTTSPIGHPRGLSTMQPLDEHPYEERRQKRLPIAVELCIDYSIPNFMTHTSAIYIGSESDGLMPLED